MWQRLLFIGCVGWFAVGCAVEDGGACEEDDDCKSERCGDGYCAGSACSEPGDHSDCSEGWECTHIPPSWADDIAATIGRFFGGDGEPDGVNLCQPTCGHCPPNYHCGERTEGLCDYGPPTPSVTFPATLEAARGEPVEIAPQVSLESGTIVRCVWTLPDPARAGTVTVETVAPSLSHRFETTGSHYVDLTVHADNGTSSNAYTSVNVRGVAGDPCYYATDCSGELSCEDGACR